MAGLAARLDPLNLEFVAENLKVPWGKLGVGWGMGGLWCFFWENWDERKQKSEDFPETLGHWGL